MSSAALALLAATWLAQQPKDYAQPKDYMRQRASLIDSECSASLGGAAALTSKELAADKVIRAAKAEMYASPLPIARSFFQSAPEMRDSKLFRLLQPLPKGAALHLHFDSLLETRWFVERTYEADCYVCWPPTAASPIAFRFLPSDTKAHPGCASPAGWQLVASLRGVLSLAPTRRA
eukprot:6950822-Prymnesium_polylepis.1